MAVPPPRPASPNLHRGGGLIRRDEARALRRLRARVAELTEAVNARDEFLAIATHELRNPMTPILGQIELLLRLVRSDRDISPERLAQGLEKLEYGAAQFRRRASMLLDVARFNAGRFEPDAKDVDLSELVRGVAETHALVARYAGVALELDVAEGVCGRCDRLAVEQIADNLVSNAIKYGRDNPVRIQLARDGDQAVLQVRDGGPGIGAADQARIFGKFERAVGGREHAGVGIGLWVVRKLVDALGGRIDVQSRPGEGSSFTVTLPLRQSKDDR
ncbi:MAG TPA: HAMP domain-containing sensor histidine kinase [Caulobacteraceae bacterium]|nr:HAMP domain-containing sensor histidine kinase [Caulobacteraceae bacterium]